MAILAIVLACTETPTPTATPVPPTVTPVPPTPTPVFDLTVTEATTWRDVFNGLTPAEQTCFRTELGGDLESALREPVLEGKEIGSVSPYLFECLAQETAEYLLVLIIAALVTSDGFSATDEQETCFWQRIDGGDIPLMVRGIFDNYEPVMEEMLAMLGACMPEVLLLEFLFVDVDALTVEERDCLTGWSSNQDWSILSSSIAFEDGTAAAVVLLQGVANCSPGLMVGVIAEGYGYDLDELTGEEQECLESWVGDFNWLDLDATQVWNAFDSGAFPTGFLTCAPRLANER